MIKFARNDIPENSSEEWERNWNHWFEETNKFYEEIRHTIGLTDSIWSMFNVRDFNDVPFPNATKMVYLDHWGEGPVEVELPKKPSWLDLWIAANYLIKQSGDTHHTFIENLVTSNNSNIVELFTGS